ncbi:MAG: formylglycine-generating enzyme family protein [Sedimentisphaerales bacterium]|jgi:formylglycine-generating enzyme required for sulfatase activity
MKTIMAVFVSLFIAVAVIAAEKTPSPKTQAAALQKKAAAEAGMPLEKTVELGVDVNMVLVYIPAGEFDMGSPATEIDRDSDEGQHHIKLTKAFYMGKFEVTQLQYRTLMNENNSKFGGDKLPIENVSWYSAGRFLKILSDKTGLKFRLPTEAQWEYACRAGTTTAFNTGTTIDSDLANYNAKDAYADGIIGKYLNRTTDVGSYQPNAFGLYDMHGNVWEWCSDIYEKDYYKITPNIDPNGPQVEGSRVIRGGGWDEKAYRCRSANRDYRGPKADRSDIGFRVVLDID